jgi:hypothetical protein
VVYFKPERRIRRVRGYLIAKFAAVKFYGNFGPERRIRRVRGYLIAKFAAVKFYGNFGPGCDK